MPSLLANHLRLLLTSQELKAKQKGAEGSLPSGFILQMQSATLQAQTLIIYDSHETHTNSSDQIKIDITVLDQ